MSLPADYKQDYEFSELSEKMRLGQELDSVDIRNRLMNYQQGMEVEDIVAKYGSDIGHLISFIGRANPLFAELTNRNSSKAELDDKTIKYRAEVQDHTDDIPLERKVVPKLPYVKTCKQDAEKTLNAFMKLSCEKGMFKTIDTWAQLVFNASNHRFPYLQIEKPGDVKFITSSFNKRFDRKRWYLTVKLQDTSKNNPNRKVWEAAMPEEGQIEFIEKENKDVGFGSAQLIYQRKDFEKLLKEYNKSKSNVRKIYIKQVYETLFKTYFKPEFIE